MAASISEAQAELISSLAPDDIPIKLRCAICSKLAVNAFRLPCCEQGICDACQASLPTSCPVCEHSPLSAEDCNPNKSLRTTIRVFLRTAEKKREANRPKDSKDSAPVKPVDAVKPSLPVAGQPAPEENGKLGTNGHTTAVESQPRPGDDHTNAQPRDVTQANPTIKEAGRQNEPGQDEEYTTKDGNEDVQASDAQDAALAEKMDGDDQAGEDQNSMEEYGADNVQGDYSNMNFTGSGDLNQMQMMMAMQNGMAPNSYGGFPMMGMPGMGMDPMMMQNMYMNGGFQGMGMNSMGNFGGGFDQGSNDNWNGSQSWNFDQNNYNQSGPGMGTGDFGNFNSGFQTGYNQGNYGHQFNDYRRNNFGRGRGRGRGYYGGYGRGGWYGGGNSQYHEQGQYSQHGVAPYAQAQTDSVQLVQAAAGGAHDESSQDVPPKTGDGEGPSKDQEPGNDSAAGAKQDTNGPASLEAPGNDVADVAMPNAPTGPSVPSGSLSGNAPSGAIRSVLSAPDVPMNAPTGPKAMRQGLPNTSLHHLRARGFQVGGDGPLSAKSTEASHRASSGGDSRSRSQSRDTRKERDSQRDRSRETARESEQRDSGRSHDNQDQGRERSRSASRTNSRSRSRSQGHRSSQRRQRPHSESAGGDKDTDGDYRRKRHRSGRRSHPVAEEDGHSRSKEERYDDRSRSGSPEDERRSGHRSRKDYERRKERDTEKHRDDDYRSSDHRSHRDKDYDSSRRRDRDKERDRDRKDRKERRRERDRERDHGHSSSSRKQSVDSPATPVERDSKPPTGPRSLDIRGASSRPSQDRPELERHASQGSSGAPGVKSRSGKDPHQLEREARNRERLLKEAQRMAGLAGMAGSKRGRDNGDEGAGSRKGRRTERRRSETLDRADEEERMRRLETEREGGRWG